ncbi:hypothetical protein [Falsiroseomonas sp.]|uniref:hypothetical protein n=1 Tax=Falsiroseomonas sp. TaxID=2870721 RepID=UPI0034A0F18B
MKAIALADLGIKRWQDIRPIDPDRRIDGGDFEAFAAYYGMGDVEAGACLLSDMRLILAFLKRGQVEVALKHLEYTVGD